MVNDLIIIEVKSIETLLPVHHKQLFSYLKFLKKPLRILVNFNTDTIDKNIIRIANDKHNPELLGSKNVQ